MKRTKQRLIGLMRRECFLFQFQYYNTQRRNGKKGSLGDEIRESFTVVRILVKSVRRIFQKSNSRLRMRIYLISFELRC